MTAPTRPAGLGRRLRRTRRRAAALAGLLWLRGTFSVLQVVAPAAADRKALDVWCTLPPGAHRRHDHRPHPGEVRRLEVSGGRQITVEVWGAGPVVYLMHGWGGWRGQLGALVAPLVEAGHQVVAIDAPGHGDADHGMLGPRRGTVMEMIEALEVAGRELGPAAAVVGHSLGTTVVARAVRGGLRAERLVLLSPNPAFAELLGIFARTLGLNPRTTGHLQAALEDITRQSIDDFDLVPMGADGTMPDTLVIHDTGDREAPHAVGAALVARWPNARLVTTTGLGHYRILRAPQTVAAAVGHITGVVAPEPA